MTADAEPATVFDMAVSAGGHTLLAWAALEHRIRASYDGGPAVTVTTARGAGSPRLALRDDGSAVLAFAASGGRVMVAGRLPSGEWTAPARISPRGRGPDDLGATADFEVRLDAALAGDGRAAVAWVSSGRLLAAAGRPGGPWTAAVPLSSPLRATAFYSVRAEPGGGPRIVWSEPEGNLSGFVRGARLVADAQAPPPGLTPPGLSTRLPARAPARAGRVVVRVPVRCSEPCDAILRLTERSETVQAGRLLPAAAGRRSG